MSPYKAARALLLQALGPIVGERLRPDRRYQPDTLPAAAYSITGLERYVCLDGAGTESYSGLVTVWAATRDDADAAAQALSALDGQALIDQDDQWVIWIDDYAGAAELVAPESDRPEYQVTRQFELRLS